MSDVPTQTPASAGELSTSAMTRRAISSTAPVGMSTPGSAGTPVMKSRVMNVRIAIERWPGLPKPREAGPVPKGGSSRYVYVLLYV